MKLLILLLLAACSTTPIQDLEEELVLCIKGGYLCAELQEEIDRRERAKEKREQARRPKCPDGYVTVCDSRFHKGCGSRHAEVKEYTCMRRGDIRWALGGW